MYFCRFLLYNPRKGLSLRRPEYGPGWVRRGFQTYPFAGIEHQEKIAVFAKKEDYEKISVFDSVSDDARMRAS